MLDNISECYINFGEERSLRIDIVTDNYQFNISLGKTSNKIHVDIENTTLEFDEDCLKNEIDDVLHKIIVKKWSNINDPDIIVNYSRDDNLLNFSMSSQYSKNIIWDGDTAMIFLITEYNDPNLIYKMFSVKINDLVGKTVTVKNVSYDNFSVYTRRLFKNYVIELK